MPHTKFESLLTSLKNKSLPQTPSIEAKVLRRIRETAAGNEPGSKFDWLEALLVPRFASTCLALVLLTSMTVAAWSTASRQRAENYPNSAAVALGFDTFQANDLLALSSPSTW